LPPDQIQKRGIWAVKQRMQRVVFGSAAETSMRRPAVSIAFFSAVSWPKSAGALVAS
jgi:hypothetical protein